MQLVLEPTQPEEAPAATRSEGKRANNTKKDSSSSPPLSAPTTPDCAPSSCSDADHLSVRTGPVMPTPLVVRSNVQRRTVGVGEDGMTPVSVRVVEMTPGAERLAKQYGPSETEEVLDFGSPVAKPAGGGGGGGGGKKRNKKKKKKKK